MTRVAALAKLQASRKTLFFDNEIEQNTNFAKLCNAQ
jgi:hypothetical protein